MSAGPGAARALGAPLAAHWALAAACALFLLIAALALDDYGVGTTEEFALPGGSER